MSDCPVSKHPWFVWHGPVDYCDSFSTVGRYLLQAMRRHGFSVAVQPRTFSGQKPIHDVHKELAGVQASVPAGAKAVTVSMIPPWEFPVGVREKGDVLVPYTTLETDRLAEPSLSRIRGSKLRNQSWVPSAFAERVLRESCDAVASVVPHGVDLTRFAHVSQVLPPGRKVVIFGAVAGCSPRKDFPTMVRGFREAFDGFDDVRLEIVTNTFFHRVPDAFLKGCLKEVGIDIDSDLTTWNPKAFMGTTGFETLSQPKVACIALPATTPHTAIASYLRNGIDIYVSTSKGEGFNMPALEALACGKPAIMPDVGGHCEYFSEQVGWPVGTTSVSVDDKGLARQGYTSWRQVNLSDLRAAYRGARGRAHEVGYSKRLNTTVIAERFSWDHVADKACAVLRSGGHL